jgi:hypothetical protein
LGTIRLPAGLGFRGDTKAWELGIADGRRKEVTWIELDPWRNSPASQTRDRGRSTAPLPTSGVVMTQTFLPNATQENSTDSRQNFAKITLLWKLDLGKRCARSRKVISRMFAEHPMSTLKESRDDDSKSRDHDFKSRDDDFKSHDDDLKSPHDGIDIADHEFMSRDDDRKSTDDEIDSRRIVIVIRGTSIESR